MFLQLQILTFKISWHWPRISCTKRHRVLLLVFYIYLTLLWCYTGQKHTFISCQFNKCSFNLYVLIFAWVLGCKFSHQSEFWSPHSSKKMFSLTCISFITLRIWQGTNGGLGNLIIIFIFQSFVLHCNGFHWIPTIHFWYLLAHSGWI